MDKFKSTMMYRSVLSEIEVVAANAALMMNKREYRGDEAAIGALWLHSARVLKKIMSEVKDMDVDTAKNIVKNAIDKVPNWFGVNWEFAAKKSEEIASVQTEKLRKA